MPSSPSILRTSHKGLPLPDFEQVALVLQGGGALGSYQAGVYQAIDEAGIRLDWIAGVSIGAINGALIAGAAPADRIANLQAFWRELSCQPVWIDCLAGWPKSLVESEAVRIGLNHLSAMSALTTGVKSMFVPRIPSAWFWPAGSVNATSVYDTTPLKEALRRFVDFDLLNAGTTRFSVGAVNVRTGNFDYFDTTTTRIEVEHILASAALPPMFAPVEIDGERYWDGGLVSNTPLQWVTEQDPQRDTLVFQVDLWNTRGQWPTDIAEVLTRQKEIQYASRTHASTDNFCKLQRLKNEVFDALADLPSDVGQRPSIRALKARIDRKVFRIVHLIYHARRHQGTTKDFEFSRLNIDEHWSVGYRDAVATLRHPEALSRPEFGATEGVETFDVAIDGRV